MNERSIPVESPVPVRLSHIVLRVTDIEASIDFYEKLLGMHVNYRAGGGGAALSYDGEHHRMALIQVPEGEPGGGAGLEHMAFKVQSIGHLVGNYRRVKELGIEPFMVLHHGGTLSSYFRDPDGMQVEVFIDAMPMEAGIDYMFSEEFAKNPIGSPVDIDDLAARYEAGEPVAALLVQPEFDEAEFIRMVEQLTGSAEKAASAVPS